MVRSFRDLGLQRRGWEGNSKGETSAGLREKSEVERSCLEFWKDIQACENSRTVRILFV